MTATQESDAAWERARELAADEVVDVASRMVAFNTEAADEASPPKDDLAHQEYVATYLRNLGADVELFEPATAEFADHRMALPGQSFAGRPILWATVPGRDALSLLFNGHYDTVLAGPVDKWTEDPWSGGVRNRRLYGRGSCDMKGGIAAALAAVSGLVRAGIELPGPVLFNIVPFEEINGIGTTATMLRGLRADAAVCCEPTELRPSIACRGLLALRLEVDGRAAHAEIPQLHHSQGGGVSAIDKLVDLLGAVRVLNESWRERPDQQHPLLSTPVALATIADGGAHWATWPAAASATFDITYLPQNVDADGYGSRVRAEIEHHVLAAAELDDWLRAHPPRFNWFVDFPPVEIDPEEPIVRSALAAVHRNGEPDAELDGFDSWADQVMLAKEGGIPTVLLGPGSILQAHTADEYVEVDELRRATAVYIDLMRSWWELD